MSARDGHGIRWVLFDWGNVLVDYRPIGFVRLAEHVGTPLDDMVEALGARKMVRQLCVGEASPGALCDFILERFGASITPDDVMSMFVDDVRTRLPDTERLVSALRSRYRLSILSNTFFGHWHELLRDPFYRVFEHPMASHLLGLEKPDPRIYQHALSTLGAAPNEVVFVDDKLENITAARELGLHAIHAPTRAETWAGLRALGCLY